MASITKLFTTTCIFILKEQDRLSLDDKVTKYFHEDTLRNLHIYKDGEYSRELTLSNLLFQTSGLPDVLKRGDQRFPEPILNLCLKLIPRKMMNPSKTCFGLSTIV